MTNKWKYNLFVLLSMLGRSMIETFPPLILYNYGIGLKGIILYFAFRYLFAIPINCIFVKLIQRVGFKIMIILSSILIGVTYYYLYNMDNNLLNIIVLALLTSTYVYSYWTVRNYYMLQVINNKDIASDMSSISIVNTLALMPSVYIGAFILKRYGLFPLIIVVFVINLISIVPLLSLKQENIKSKNSKNIKNIPFSSLIMMVLEQFKTIILSLFPLYIYIHISNDYTYLGVFNFLIGLASILVLYIFSKIMKIKKRSYLKFTIIGLSICFFIKLLIKNQYTFLSIAVLEGLFIKMQELSINSNIYRLGKNFDYMHYILITENIFNISRLIISILTLFINDITTILMVCIIGFITCSLFKFDIEPKT